MRRPNFLIFMTDHQRGDTSRPAHPAVTPHLDPLAAGGLTFTDLSCPSPHCCPARATFHSGLYPSRHGVWNNVCNDQALRRGPFDDVRLWSEDLAASGYDLAFTGKWHVSSLTTPADHGWRERSVSGTKPREHQSDWEHYRRVARQGTPAGRGEGQILRPGYGTYTLYGTREADPNGHDERTIVEAVDFIEPYVNAK